MNEGTKILIAAVLAVFIGIRAGGSGNASEKTPLKGERFPDIRLAVPEKEAEKSYLGLSGKGTFALSDVKADVLIIEIFSMYCPYCQKEAPLVNQLFETIGKAEDVKNRIKVIGIGAGNTPFEVDVFRTQYAVPFPLFDDQSYDVYKRIGEVRTPYFFVLKLHPDRSNTIVYSKVGTIGDPAQFLAFVRDEAGLK